MQTASLNNTTLSFIDQGTGPVILFVHGFPLDHSMWNGQIEILSSRYRVIAPDLRGFGQSPVSDSLITMEQFAGDLAALLDFLNIREPIVFCGLSMGGYIAWEFWRNYTDRLRGLILCDTRAANDAPETAAARLSLAKRVIHEGTEFVSEMMISKIFASITMQNQPELIDSIRQTIRGTDPRTIAAASLGMAQRANFMPDLGRIKCPTLVIVGEDNAATPVDEMRQMAQAIPNAQLTIIEQAGHMSPLEQPHAVNAAIENFLQGL